MATLPSTNTNPMETFQNKITEKLRSDIGSMLPDEVLQGLVKKAVDEHFFKERKETSSSGYHTITKPSWFVEEVGKHAQPLIEKAVSEYVKNNKEVMEKALSDFFATQNLTLLMTASMAHQMQQNVYDVVARVVAQVQRGGY